jgi:hypothetical protein
MSKIDYCDCGMPWLQDDGSCSRCERKIDPSRLGIIKENPVYKAAGEKNGAPETYEYPDIKMPRLGNKATTLEEQLDVGLQAALRTEKYSTLFENIGKLMQTLNTIGACILLVLGFFIPGSFLVKIVYWILICVLWAFSFVQTALIRGLSSYFQMRASDHIIRHWKK